MFMLEYIIIVLLYIPQIDQYYTSILHIYFLADIFLFWGCLNWRDTLCTAEQASNKCIYIDRLIPYHNPSKGKEPERGENSKRQVEQNNISISSTTAQQIATAK